MVKCSFSGHEIPKGKGKMYVRDNGTVLWFCSGKCEKNMLKLKRDPRKFKWTSHYEKGEAPVAGKKTAPKKSVNKKK